MQNNIGLSYVIVNMTCYTYKGFELRWLHQWVLIKLATENEKLHNVSHLHREWSHEQGYEMVSKQKLYRAFSRLRNANLVHVHTDRNENIEDGKSYQLNSDGRYYVKEMGSKLASPPRLRLESTVDEMNETIDYLKKQTDAQQHYIVQILKHLVKTSDMSVEQWEE